MDTNSREFKYRSSRRGDLVSAPAETKFTGTYSRELKLGGSRPRELRSLVA
jgi:hypothetical protein